MWRQALRRPERAVLVLVIGGAALTVAGFGAVTWHHQARLARIRDRVQHTSRILRLSLRAEQSLLAQASDRDVVDPALTAELARELEALRQQGRTLDPENDARLERLAELLRLSVPLRPAGLVQVVAVLNRVLEAEAAAEARLWQRVERDARAELVYAATAGMLLPLVAGGAYLIARRWLVAPLDDLRELLSRLASGDRREIATDRVHPLLAELFASYNRLVSRLAELEREHADHARGLEQRIRSATEALLEQHASLARAERLAAVGEMTASLAHELRNPLAGIRVALTNLRHDVAEPELVSRLDAVASEIDRLTRLVQDALSAARHAPEPVREVDLGRLIEELLELVRYQAPATVTLDQDAPAGLTFVLPPDRVRQALLNLVLNAIQALGSRPGTITVRAVAERDRLRLEVEDDGPGFPPDILEARIRPFAARSPGGTGLGLAMVRRVAVDLGGELQMRNLEPHGALARLSLPRHHG